MKRPLSPEAEKFLRIFAEVNARTPRVRPATSWVEYLTEGPDEFLTPPWGVPLKAIALPITDLLWSAHVTWLIATQSPVFSTEPFEA